MGDLDSDRSMELQDLKRLQQKLEVEERRNVEIAKMLGEFTDEETIGHDLVEEM